MTRNDLDALLDLLFGSLSDVMSGATVGAGLARAAAITLMVLLVVGAMSVGGQGRQAQRSQEIRRAAGLR